MNCKKCGFLLSSQDQVCPNCGEMNELFVNSNVINQVPPVGPETISTPIPGEPAPTVPTNNAVGMESQVVSQPQPMPEPTPFAQPNPTMAQPTPNMVQSGPAVGINQTTPIAPIEKKKKNTGFIVLIIILLLIIAGLGTFIAIKLLGGDNSGSGSGTSGGSNNNNGGETVNPEPVQKNDKITVDGVEFTIPSGYVKQVINGYNMLVDSTNGVMFYIDGLSNEKTYEEFKIEFKNKEAEIKSSFESSVDGVVYNGISDYTVNGHNYYSASANVQGLITDVSITSILDNYVVLVGVKYTDGNKENAYKSLDAFLHTAKKASANSFAPTITTSNLTEDIEAYLKIGE